MISNKLKFGELVIIVKFVISNHHSRGDFCESPNCANAAHAAGFVQGAVPLGLNANFVGFNWPLRGTICLAEEFTFSNP